MNELKIFENAEFGQVRTTEINGQPFFMASDVAKALGYSKPNDAVAKHCRATTKCGTHISGKIQEVNFIPEGDIYRLIIKSKLPSAERFEKWVMEEVLPSIRRTGAYSIPMTTAGQIQLLAQGCVELEQKIANVDKDLKDFKANMPLLGVDMDALKKAVNSRVVDALGGVESNAYKNKSIRGKVYSDCWNELKRQFGFVKSYKELKRNQVDQVLAIISDYEVPIILQDLIDDANSQIHMNNVLN